MSHNNITKGGVSHTDLPLRVCVYPSYNLKDDLEESAVLLCSYTWGQDAQRLGSIISENTPNGEEELKRVLLHDLALLHAEAPEQYEELHKSLYDLYETHHAWNWYRDENISGAFAYFGPGQYSNMWQEIIKPNAFGQLYLIGEAASAHHAWIVGALESVVRAMFFLFEGLNSEAPDYEPYKLAMDLLKQEANEETDPPFCSLPDEMPLRQKDNPLVKKKDLTENPRDKEKRLTYAAAVVSLAQVESFIEVSMASK